MGRPFEKRPEVIEQLETSLVVYTTSLKNYLEARVIYCDAAERRSTVAFRYRGRDIGAQLQAAEADLATAHTAYLEALTSKRQAWRELKTAEFAVTKARRW